ncbi:mRNA splicing protein [Rhodotorula toruloides]|uniref:Pre-mRNA-splicing factor SLU7 n=1 Tax=Rhodotorula toruloides TaxID=5286 RepID=A0A2T0AEN5_RHOTO|nr:Pre-mRNA splicing Prp18-interacting factor-domain containing protein [Rhodotorula toruloides]
MSGKLSREEYRRQKDLEAARKAGTAAPALDEEGKPINPHIPAFMANAPWYLKGETSTDGPSLKHHKLGLPEYNKDPGKLASRFERGAKAGPAAKKYRAGACTNCGAMTHSAKDCLERPRKVGAKYTNKNIAADEVIHDSAAHLNGLQGQGDYDAKRDRWDGYDPSMHKQVVEEYEALEAARRKLREEAIDRGTAEASSKEVTKLAKKGKAKGKGKGKGKEADESDEFGSSDESDEDGADDDEDKYAEGADVAGQKLDTKTRVTVRNLRIREDTAKYLMNLDVDSAYYDPKTRSMREAPNPALQPEDASFAGENFVRHSGGATELQKLQMFAWQSENRGHDVHIQSNPTAAALMHKEFLQQKEVLKDKSSASILDKYGGEQYLQAVPKELRVGQTENYVEYDRRGKVIKGMERAKAKSKYDEDIYPGNHQSIWGSWYQLSTGKWGYACCHSTIKGSYCAGQAGIEAADAEANPSSTILAHPSSSSASADKDAGKSLMQLKQERDDEERKKRKADSSASTGEERGKKARKEGEKEGEKGEKDFTGVTEAEMERYRRDREQRFDDPMAQLQGDELLPL